MNTDVEKVLSLGHLRKGRLGVTVAARSQTYGILLGFVRIRQYSMYENVEQCRSAVESDQKFRKRCFEAVMAIRLRSYRSYLSVSSVSSYSRPVALESPKLMRRSLSFRSYTKPCERWLRFMNKQCSASPSGPKVKRSWPWSLQSI